MIKNQRLLSLFLCVGIYLGLNQVGAGEFVSSPVKGKIRVIPLIYENADIRDIVKDLSKKTGIEINMETETLNRFINQRGSANVSFRTVSVMPFYDFLDAFTRTLGLSYIIDVNKIIVVDLQSLQNIFREEEVNSEKQQLLAQARLVESKKIPPLEFFNIGIKDFINYLMQQTQINIMVDERTLQEMETSSAGFQISICTVSELRLSDALNIGLRPSNLDWEVKPTYIWVTSRDKIGGGRMATKIFRLKYGAVDPKNTIEDYLEQSLPDQPGRNIMFDLKSSILTVTDIPANLRLAEELIKVWDTQPR